MKIGIVGAGAAGLAAGRHCYDQNYEFDIFEQSDVVGGTWNFTDLSDVDQNGLEDIHSSMYQGLKTNIPKEVMVFDGYPYSKEIEMSYIGQEEVLKYLNNFAKQSKILPFVRFFTRVLKVEPSAQHGWLVEVENVKTKINETKEFDAIMICSGHYKEPIYPDIPGLETFSGTSIHSHFYRSKEKYRNCKVLVIGAGPSGVDISQQIATVADKVYLSCNPDQKINLSEAIIRKTYVKQINRNEAEFVDGSRVEIDAILFCTGYKYSFPFLTNNCCIQVDDNYVSPLYKHLINIEHPTMALIGIPFQICPFPMFDIQIRFFLSTLSNPTILPTKEEMLNDLKEEWLRKSGIRKKDFHRIGDDQSVYFNELSRIGRVKPIPTVISKLYYYVRRNRNLNDKFHIIDDEHYLKLN